MSTGVPQLSRGEASSAERLHGLVFNKLRFDRAPDLVVSPRTEDEVIAADAVQRRTAGRSPSFPAATGSTADPGDRPSPQRVHAGKAV
jgi:hypothetical protein